MKVAVSIPDAVFEAAERWPNSAGVRGLVCTPRPRTSIDGCGGRGVTDRLDALYADEASQLSPALRGGTRASAGRHLVIRRGEIRWAELREPVGSEPGHRRPMLVVSSDRFNRSRIVTVVAVSITSNLRLGEAPGNVYLEARASGLGRDSVVNVSQVVTLDRPN